MDRPADRTLAAAGFILIFAVVIGFADNFVRTIAAEGGLWQFNVLRSVVAVALVAVLARPLGLRLRPLNWRSVAARSTVHSFAMLFYFGALAFLPVAQVAAGLFTAPIFVLLITRFVYGHAIGPVRIIAVALGFLGVLLLLGPKAVEDASPLAFVPVLGGVFYAMGNIATREWCEGESATVLTAGYFIALGLMGVVGLVVLAFIPVEVPEGTAGFVQRGWVTPSPAFLFWIFVQAAGSLLGVAMMVRAYQIAEASRVSVFEYTNLPAAAFWGWLIWSDKLTVMSIAGMVLITLAGAMIALLSPRRHAAEVSPTA